MRVTWYGTASLGVETASGRLAIDPFYPFKGSPTRVPSGAYDGYPAILVTHGHFDHIMSLPEIVAAGSGRVYCTSAPETTLKKLGVPGERIERIEAGQSMQLQGMRVTAFQSRHVRFDTPLLRRTLINRRMLRYASNLPRGLRGFLAYPQKNEIVGYLIEGEGRSLFALGSLNLDGQTRYPEGMDLLALPFQGRSDLVTPALEIIERLRPRAVLLDHWDDAFPPLSNTVDTSGIEARLRGVLPVYRLEPGGSMTV